MKQLSTIIALATLILAGCAKETAPEGYQTITIGFGGVSTGSITKAAQADAMAVIKATFPTTGIMFNLKSTADPSRSYNVYMGQEVTLPIDEYRVTMSYKPEVLSNTYKNGDIMQQPKFHVDEVIQVSNLQTSYAVSVVYDCWAMIIDRNDTKKYQHLGYSTYMEDFLWFKYTDNMGVAFISGEWGADPYRIVAYPTVELGHEAKTYNIVTNRNYEGVLVENGKWYCFGSETVEDASGTIALSFPTWQQGSTE